MFTKKHYKAIAEIIREEYQDINAVAIHSRTAVKGIVLSLADYFEQDNPNFDQDKFIAACSD